MLWSPWVRFDDVAKLAGSSRFHLRSAFRPTYNMAANLIRTYESERAHDLLNLSFAQYQADRDIVKMQARLERRRHALAELQAEATSPLGDIDEYRTLRNAEREARRFGHVERVEEIEAALRRLSPGDGRLFGERQAPWSRRGDDQCESQGRCAPSSGQQRRSFPTSHRRRLRCGSCCTRFGQDAIKFCAESERISPGGCVSASQDESCSTPEHLESSRSPRQHSGRFAPSCPGPEVETADAGCWTSRTTRP